MKSHIANDASVERKWWIIDVEDKIVGRVASEIAMLLRGKHKPTYTPHVDTGDFVVVINAEKIAFTGGKDDKKVYWHHTGYPGGIRGVKAGVMRKTKPEEIISHAVKGMLPKGPLGRRMFKKLKVYAGTDHQHDAQKPEPWTNHRNAY